MSLINRINDDLKRAMVNKDQGSLDLLRMVKSALKNELINLKKEELSEEEVLRIIKKEAKKRQDAIDLYTKGGRQDLAQKEQAELGLIKQYLPEEMGEEEIRKIVEEVVQLMGEVSPSQFGQVMGQVISKTKGQADGNVVSKIVKEVIG